MPLLYIVEDEYNILEIESYALRNAGMEVEGFETAGQFNAALTQRLPDLVLLDIMLPDEDGITVLRNLRKDPRTQSVPIIMVTAKTSEVDIVKGLEEGADDYISKPFGIMELISRVRALLRRSHPESYSDVISVGEVTLIPSKRSCIVDGSVISLTYKEFELLECLMRNAGSVMRRDILLERIWGINYGGETRTLDAHIKTLRQKLGNAGRHITTVRNVGYLLT